jgi:hypothetical protein
LAIESHPTKVKSNLRAEIAVQAVEIDPSWGVIAQSRELKCEQKSGKKGIRERGKLFRVDS